ncbi:LOW QUALITY PROTEIN: kell blood group glycoprotein homolog [Carassius gibelio]|uniref:LOW QUALITY PROTEIN: kell blood group glycoprotein homolog n=1 Tax=Carassius gibelio TaxID=101364 RepID=UPI0022781AE4|nr:LOW QUALITY PROTEIN: kell blood group glycoprotein homolog [Carassius gibelio]
MDNNPTVHQKMVTTSEEQSQPNPEGCYKNRRLLLVVLSFSLFAAALGLGVYSHLQKTADPWMSQRKSSTNLATMNYSRTYGRVLTVLTFFCCPCDYFLFACGTGGSSTSNLGHRVKLISNEENEELDTKREVRMRRETDVQGKSDAQLVKFPDRKTALVKTIKEILEAPEEGASISAAEQKAKKYFKTCTDAESPEKVGSKPFLTLLQQLGGWPVSNGWSQTDFNTTLALLMSQYSTFPFFSVYVVSEPGEEQMASDQHYIKIDEPHFQFPIDWNSKTQKSKASSQYLRPFYMSCCQYLELLGVPSNETTQHCGLYVSLATTLALAMTPVHYRFSQELLYNRYTIQELQTLAPAIDWLACLQAIFQPLPISQSDLVLVNLPYIIHMSQTISKWQILHEMMGTGPLHTYMIFSLLHTLVPALDSRFFQTMRNFSIASGDTQEEMPRWLRCVQQTERGFDTLLIHAIRQRHAQKEAEELIHDVYSSLEKKLTDLIWRDDRSSAFILKKIKSINPRLSAKTNNLSHAELNHLYEEVVLNEEDFFTNYLQMLVLEQKSRSRLLSHGTQTDGLSITPSISGNDVIIPVGMFVSPFFHSSYPRAVNYGTLGSLIAKDLLHLLLPDIHTQANNPESESMCIRSHYQSVTKDPGRVGTFSLSSSQQQEVWVQFSALQVALDAYKKSFTRHPEDSSLSGLSYIHLFLSSFTKVTCDAEFMPFEPSFLVTVLCSNSRFCPEPLSCVNKSQNHPSEMCQSQTLH